MRFAGLVLRGLALLLGAALVACPAAPSDDTRSGADVDASAPTDAGPGLDAATPGALVIDHVTIVDARGLQPDRAVLIEGRRIVEVRAAGGQWPSATRRIDGRGRYLAPGLVDPHVHLGQSGATVWVGDPVARNLRANLYHGVTSVMDVGGPRSLYGLARQIEDGSVLGPSLLATGPFLTTAGSHPCETFPYAECIFVDGTNAKARAQELIALGAPALKVALADAAFSPWPTPRLDLAALRAITALGVPVIAHVDTSADLADAVTAGVSIVAHPPFDAPITADALAKAKTARGVHTTIGAFAAVLDLLEGKLDPASPDVVVGPGVAANWQYVRENPGVLLPGYIDETRKWTANASANVKAMRAASVPLVPASDAGYLFVAHGLGLHRELARLAALGFTPKELFAGATRDARALLGLPGGHVEAGAPADLLLLRGDPSARIEALDAIDLVVVRGRAFDRADLLTAPLSTRVGAAGEACVSGAVCATGLACDGIDHVCRASCSIAKAPVDACGSGAHCISASGVSGAPYVCHEEATCDVYAQSCGPAFYSLGCVPVDSNTSVCRAAGPRSAGQTCTQGPAGACAKGLYCSPIDGLCYALCDPASATPGCTLPLKCEQQVASPTVPWFGLCL